MRAFSELVGRPGRSGLLVITASSHHGIIVRRILMWDIPENIIDPPDHWTCEECYRHFYPNYGEEPGEDERVLCYECETFDG